jgi:hypothetical protein
LLQHLLSPGDYGPPAFPPLGMPSFFPSQQQSMRPPPPSVPAVWAHSPCSVPAVASSRMKSSTHIDGAALPRVVLPHTTTETASTAAVHTPKRSARRGRSEGAQSPVKDGVVMQPQQEDELPPVAVAVSSTARAMCTREEGDRAGMPPSSPASPGIRRDRAVVSGERIRTASDSGPSACAVSTVASVPAAAEELTPALAVGVKCELLGGTHSGRLGEVIAMDDDGDVFVRLEDGARAISSQSLLRVVAVSTTAAPEPLASPSEQLVGDALCASDPSSAPRGKVGACSDTDTAPPTLDVVEVLRVWPDGACAAANGLLSVPDAKTRMLTEELMKRFSQ